MDNHQAIFTALAASLPFAPSSTPLKTADKEALLNKLPEAYRPLFDHDGLLVVEQFINEALPDRAAMRHSHISLCGWYQGMMVCFALYDDESAYNQSVPQPIARVACTNGSQTWQSPKQGHVLSGDTDSFIRFVETYFISTLGKVFAAESNESGQLEPSFHCQFFPPQAGDTSTVDAQALLSAYQHRQQQG